MFKSSKRDNGESFLTLTGRAPEWLIAAVRAAHQGDMPDDWVYSECEAAYTAESDLTDSDTLHEHADSRVDVYTKVLFQWSADHCLGTMYANAESEADDMGVDSSDVEKRFQAIQYCAIQRIAATIAEAKAENE